jgi:hypothetical protein
MLEKAFGDVLSQCLARVVARALKNRMNEA